MDARVILIHGLWMRAFSLGLLRKRLVADGFAVDTFDYASVAGGPEPAIAQLRERLRAAPTITTHLVGHSLGGLVALEALRNVADLPHGRVVCLGSPLRGSRAAQRLSAWPGGTWLVGRSLDLLRRGIADWDGSREVGVIAGRVPFGLGVLVDGLAHPHDGTVAVAETELPGIAAHTVVAATHTGLVFSDEVAQLTGHFLRHGRLPAPTS
jgi:alpha-beta hydrolase superfamily lysophospholipase